MQDNYDIKKLVGKKKRVNSRNKGATFERQVASLLNDRFSTKEFSRTPGSGAFATTHSLPDYLTIYGDLITPKNFSFCIECKKGYNNLKLNHILDYSSELWKFLDQCDRDAQKISDPNVYPMVIFKQDRQKTLVFTKKFFSLEIEPHIIIAKSGEPHWAMYYFDDLLQIEDWYWFN